MKNIIMTGGGTAGHVTPNMAVIPQLRKLGYTIHYIGTKEGLEKTLICNMEIPYYEIEAGKLRRYFDVKNFTDVGKITKGVFQASSIIRKIKPDVIFSKGGFVSCPVVWAGWLRRVPVIIHESDYSPGLANKLCYPFANKICYTFSESKKYFSEDKATLTGIPLRDSLFNGSAQRGRNICNFNSNKPIIMVTGGSQGAENINNAVRNSLDMLLKKFQVCHICGKGKLDDRLANMPGYFQIEYANEEQSHFFKMSDIIISRAGATSIFEILGLQKPNILIPLSEKASRGDQILNAASFQNRGFSYVIKDEELNKETLINGLEYVYNSSEKFIEKMKMANAQNSNKLVVDIIQQVANSV